MRLLYPCDPFNSKLPDEEYREEFDAAIASGLACSLFSLEDFQGGEFKPRPKFDEAEVVAYRGWMLDIDDYSRLSAAMIDAGAKPLVNAVEYQRCHHLPGWYQVCVEWTPETVFVDQDINFTIELAKLNWPAYFVKDYVKSLTTSRGSIAKNAEEVTELVALIKQYRGKIEGGICIRRFESLQPDTEERYFVLRGTPYGRDGTVPDLVRRIAAAVDSPFFSVDTVLSADGHLRLIELGDGQVSDRKLWPAENFARMLAQSGI
ncbi:ATP-grasp domain-containing protein [Duganella sp. BJB1802]|uniref:ATP-grasp domain-containing protein n=1 Tax=Duganella sp. BJB1802 TaxID=2744575 RepID=UPI001592C58B|nr:ATP-grasp domain-containing protein [Duganella sp. BJB1802]NVD69834.1 ATP-grasp domain-containing protein [Duganella sp. BJB1802]